VSRFWNKIKKGLLMTHDEMWDRLATAVRSRDGGPILESLEEALIGADIGVELTQTLLEGLEENHGEWEIMRTRLQDRITAILTGAPFPDPGSVAPRITLLVGVNGSGKTTTAAKLASREMIQGYKPLLVAADTFRAGAIDQLKIWGERLNVPVIAHQPGGDPAAVVYDALNASASREANSIIIDTAGRLHTKAPLMAELSKIYRIIERYDPDAPHLSLLVLDATSGQNGLVQAKEFLNAVHVNGVILTKLDGTAKGGVVVRIVNELGLPVLFVGVGEGTDDLIPFDPEDFSRALFAEE